MVALKSEKVSIQNVFRDAVVPNEADITNPMHSPLRNEGISMSCWPSPACLSAVYTSSKSYRKYEETDDYFRLKKERNEYCYIISVLLYDYQEIFSKMNIHSVQQRYGSIEGWWEWSVKATSGFNGKWKQKWYLYLKSDRASWSFSDRSSEMKFWRLWQLYDIWKPSDKSAYPT